MRNSDPARLARSTGAARRRAAGRVRIIPSRAVASAVRGLAAQAGRGEESTHG
jgi:hypothetical protein